jgi:hypothetical protein
MAPPLLLGLGAALLSDRLLASCLVAVALAAGHLVALIPDPAGALVLVAAAPDAETYEGAIDVQATEAA